MANKHKYRLKYQLKKQVGEFEHDSFTEEDGGTDAMVIGSMIFPEDGSYSQNFWSFEGRRKGEPLSDEDLFKFWMMMGATLGEKSSLHFVKREIAKMPMDAYFKIVEGGRNGGGQNGGKAPARN